MKNRVLFVSDKWCGGDPNLGWSNNFHNLFNSFSQCAPKYTWNTLHMDEAAVFGAHINDVLPRYCIQHDINIVFISFLGQSPLNPSIAVLEMLKKMGVYICIHWPDSNPNDLLFRDELRQAGLETLNVIWDNPVSTLHDALQRHSNDLYLWVPQDTCMFFRTIEKPIPVSFVGNPTFADRFPALDVLSKKFPDAYIGGGQRQQRLTPYQYAEIIRKSEICINFAGHPAGYHQVKGRVYEVLTCGGLLMESKNPATSKIFKPNEHYVEFDGPDDLIKQVERYNKLIPCIKEGNTIWANGHKRLTTRYSSQLFWDTIMSRIQQEI